VLVNAGAFLSISKSTASNFSQDARRFVDRIEKKIVLVDGEQLTQLMIEHNVGVAMEETYTVKKIDLDYFEEA
jgi:restriction system protein